MQGGAVFVIMALVSIESRDLHEFEVLTRLRGHSDVKGGGDYRVLSCQKKSSAIGWSIETSKLSKEEVQ